MVRNLEIKQFWDEQAKAHGIASAATMPDQFLKDLEVKNIAKYLGPGLSVADLGCGNGYSTFHYASAFDIRICGLDYSDMMIQKAEEAKEKLDEKIRLRVQFRVGDIKGTDFPASSYDCVITDRCLINLVSREEQQAAIHEVHRILRTSGLYLMCEDTENGLAKLNVVRHHVGLPPISVRWHNLYLDESHILKTISGIFKLVEIVNFSSFYYLASRIVNGKIAQEQGVEPRYDSEINRVAAACSSLACFGDFGPLKLFVLRKQ